jgi:phosphohistidine phosphatase
MRYLYLLRHAEAAPVQAGGDDKFRPLTTSGMATASALGAAMKAKNYIPDFVICSPARRTQQTLRKLCETMGDFPAVYPPAAYYTTMGQLYELLKGVDENKNRVLLISHNPSIHALVRFLAGLGVGQAMEDIRQDYRECMMTVLECPVESWSALMPAENDLHDVLLPGRDFSGNP